MVNSGGEKLISKNIQQNISCFSRLNRFNPILILLCFSLFAITFLTYQNYQLKKQIADKQDTNNLKIVNHLPEQNTPETVSDLPEINTLYYTNYVGRVSIFFTNKNQSEYFVNGEKKFDPYRGLLYGFFNNTTYADFREIYKPKKIQADLSSGIVDLTGLMLNESKTKAYISLIKLIDNGTYNSLLEIPVNNLTARELWTDNLGSKKYSNTEGSASILTISSDGKFSALELRGCYECEGSDSSILILNNQTSAEKFLGKVGNLFFNEDAKTISYQKLSPFTEPCELGMGCENGKHIVMKPAGKTLLETLP